VSADDTLILQHQIEQLRGDVTALDGRMVLLERLPDRLAKVEEIQSTLRRLPKWPKRQASQAAFPLPPVVTPVKLVAQAQHDARVEPTDKCFFGSAECVYTFQTGKVYVIYLTPLHATSVSLPPTERARESLVLDPEEFTVKQLVGGSDSTAYSVVSLRPKVDKADLRVVLLTESGRRYLLQLIVGKIGFQSVVFELPALHTEPLTPQLILPRPAS
jgi:hypothetical protein